MPRADEILIVEGKQNFEALLVKKPSGAIIIDGNHVADTLTCAHCGYTWIPIKGSGIVRGWCTHCNKPTCGDHKCDVCLPLEKKMELYEKGKIKQL